MKKSLLALAVLGAYAGVASAQSSVTLYGTVDLSAKYVKNDGSSRRYSLSQDGINSSQLGFKGTEDLGGGLKAFFLIEHGFGADSGRADGRGFWARESNVGLEGSFGKVRLGNMGPTAAYFATADYISMHNHDTGTSSDAFYAGVGANDFVLRNAIAYATPNIAGFTAEAQLGLKETNAADTKHTFVLAGNYDAGPLHLGAAYVNAPADTVTTKLGTAKQFGVRALYEMGPFTVGAYFINDKAELGGVEDKRNSYRVSAMYALGASEFHVNVGVAGKIKENGVTLADTNATQFTLGYNYNLSKRTKVYGFYTQVDNKANAAYAVSVDGTKFSSFALGLRHNF
jgi:predicted porin